MPVAGVPASSGGVPAAGTWMRSPGEPGRRGARRGVAGAEPVILWPMIVDADASSMSRLPLPPQRLAFRMSPPACARRGLRAARDTYWTCDPSAQGRGGGVAAA